MFSVRNGCFILLFFSREIVVQSQMDVLLKRTSSVPILHNSLPTAIDVIPDSDSSSDSQEFPEPPEDLKAVIRRIEKQFNSDNNQQLINPYPLSPSVIDSKPTNNLGISEETPTLESPESEGQNPLRDIFRLIDETMQFDSQPPKNLLSPDMLMRNNLPRFPVGQKDDQDGPIGVLTIIRVDDDGMVPPQGYVNSPAGSMDKKGSDDVGPSFVQGFLSSFMEAMNDMVDLLHKTNGSVGVTGKNGSGGEQKVDIKIKDHGKTYEIPPDALVERNVPDMVNITWKSELKDFNNSLCMNVSRNRDGVIVFHHIRLKMLNDNGIQEYNREDPILVGENNGTEINLEDGVGINFPHPDSLDVVVVEKRGKFSVQWMAVSIALLGLIVAALVMLLSYILHTRNTYTSRKDSMFKEPIA